MFHPVAIFITSLLALGLAQCMTILWYLRTNSSLAPLLAQEAGPHSWVFLLILSILIALILAGMVLIFIYYQKSIQIYRLQASFINNFTHELKTPLASIKLYLETFRKYDVGPEQKGEFIGFMLKDTERLSHHVSQILQLGALESRIQKHPMTPTPLITFLEKFLQENRHLFGDSSDVEFRVDPALAARNGCEELHYPLNPKLFEVILINLITNAIKYNQSERPAVQIGLTITDEGHARLLFCDNGIGIDRKEFHQIFEKFYRVERKINRTVKGSGLGLYTARLVSKMHGVTLRLLESTPQLGSTFALDLPKKRITWKDASI